MVKKLPRLEHLVSLRGIAAWWVVFFHSLSLTMTAWPDMPSALIFVISHGYLAVDFFFVLSGFIIFINYYGKFEIGFRSNLLPFYWNRLTRIYPLHLVLLVAYLLLACAFIYTSQSHATPLAFEASSFIENVFLVHAWKNESTSWNVPSWSVSAEWFVYLLFPFMALGLAKFAQTFERKLVVASGIIAIVVLITLVEKPTSTASVLALPLVRAFHEFLLGTIAGSLFMHHRGWLHRGRNFLILVVAVILAAGNYAGISNYILVPIFCFGSICILSVDNSLVTRILTNKFLVYVGEISYSTYMVHYFVKDLFKAIWVKNLSIVSMPGLIASFAAVFFLSMLLHRLLEIPAQRFLRERFFVRRSKSSILQG